MVSLSSLSAFGTRSAASTLPARRSISAKRSIVISAGEVGAGVGTEAGVGADASRGASATNRDVSLRTSSSSIRRTSGLGSRMVASSSGLWSVTAGSGAPVCSTIPCANRGTTGSSIAAHTRARFTASVSSRRAPSGSVAMVFHGCFRCNRSFPAAATASAACTAARESTRRYACIALARWRLAWCQRSTPSASPGKRPSFPDRLFHRIESARLARLPTLFKSSPLTRFFMSPRDKSMSLAVGPRLAAK